MDDCEHAHIPLPHFKIVAVITDREKIDVLSEILINMHVRMHYTFHALGSASSEILDMFGLADSEKAVAICIEPDFRVPLIMEEITDKMALRRHGNGVAFSIPISGISRPVTVVMDNDEVYELKERCDKPKMENEVETLKENASYDLIIAVVNPGFSEELMETARPAGAKGGTVLHARRVGNEDFVKFFGISVQEEREVVAILTARDAKKDIMKAIISSYGIRSEARGMIFSMPVDSIAGIN